MARFQAKLSLSWFGLARFKPNSVCPDLGWPVSSQSQFVLIWAGPSQAKLRKWLRGLKQTCFLRFYTICCPILFASRQSLCTWHGYFVKRIKLGLLMAAVYPTETKVRHSTGVATTNSTYRYPNANKLSWAINYTITRIMWSWISLVLNNSYLKQVFSDKKENIELIWQYSTFHCFEIAIIIVHPNPRQERSKRQGDWSMFAIR